MRYMFYNSFFSLSLILNENRKSKPFNTEIYLNTCIPTYFLPAYLFFCQPVCLSVCLSACLPFFLPACLSGSRPACLPTYFSVCLPVSLLAYSLACLPDFLPAFFCFSVCLPA
jgi:hypothetical protein